MAITSAQLLGMSQKALDDLFAGSPAGPIPNGEAKGTAIIAPGTVFSREIAEFVNVFTWKGKTFDGARGVLTNRILSIGLNAIVAEVYIGPSWVDGKDCVILDYSKTSLVAGWIRDEIRLVDQNIYLGVVFGGKTRLINFCLEFQAT